MAYYYQLMGADSAQKKHPPQALFTQSEFMKRNVWRPHYRIVEIDEADTVMQGKFRLPKDNAVAQLAQLPVFVERMVFEGRVNTFIRYEDGQVFREYIGKHGPTGRGVTYCDNPDSFTLRTTVKTASEFRRWIKRWINTVSAKGYYQGEK